MQIFKLLEENSSTNTPDSGITRTNECSANNFRMIAKARLLSSEFEYQ